MKLKNLTTIALLATTLAASLGLSDEQSVKRFMATNPPPYTIYKKGSNYFIKEDGFHFYGSSCYTNGNSNGIVEMAWKFYFWEYPGNKVKEQLMAENAQDTNRVEIFMPGRLPAVDINHKP